MELKNGALRAPTTLFLTLHVLQPACCKYARHWDARERGEFSFIQDHLDSVSGWKTGYETTGLCRRWVKTWPC